MSSPFPGMDPYLEEPDLWFEFHSRMIHALSDALAARLPAGYTVRVERGVLLTEEETGQILGRLVPDLTIVPQGVPRRPAGPSPAGVRGAIAVEAPLVEPIELARLIVRRRGVERDVVSVIELLSPVNKTGAGRAKYLAKRRECLATRTSLVEIDLLRAGERLPVVGDLPAADYVAFVFRGWERPRGWLYAWDVPEPLPAVAVPLTEQDGEVLVPLREALDLAYDRGRYAGEVDYRSEPVPPLTPGCAAWADRLLRDVGIR